MINEYKIHLIATLVGLGFVFIMTYVITKQLCVAILISFIAFICCIAILILVTWEYLKAFFKNLLRRK